jgi:hypothetical protein
VQLENTPAQLTDRDGAPDLLRAIRFRHPWLRHVFADGGYSGDKLKEVMAGQGRWTIKIVKRADTANGFVALPRRRSWSGHSHGWDAAVASRRTGRNPSKAPPPSHSSPASACSRDASQDIANPRELVNRALVHEDPLGKLEDVA